MNDDMRFKIAGECVKTQLKMREQFIKEFIENTNVESLGEEAMETLKSTLTIAYNKGAADALSIFKVIDMVDMEGGDDYDI